MKSLWLLSCRLYVLRRGGLSWVSVPFVRDDRLHVHPAGCPCNHHHHRFKGSGTPEWEPCRPPSGPLWAPAASWLCPGCWVLPLAPAPSWALSGAPGREDRRHRQQPGSQNNGAGHPNGEQLPPSSGATVGPAASRPWPGPWVLPWLRLRPGPLSGALAARIAASGSGKPGQWSGSGAAAALHRGHMWPRLAVCPIRAHSPQDHGGPWVLWQ